MDQVTAFRSGRSLAHLRLDKRPDECVLTEGEPKAPKIVRDSLLLGPSDLAFSPGCALRSRPIECVGELLLIYSAEFVSGASRQALHGSPNLIGELSTNERRHILHFEHISHVSNGQAFGGMQNIHRFAVHAPSGRWPGFGVDARMVRLANPPSKACTLGAGRRRQL